VFKATHSRREADSLIASGRVTINKIPVTSKGGMLVKPYEDVVHLDGKLIEGWEVLNSIARVDQKDPSTQTNKGKTERTPSPSVFQYIKYWKPIGAVCTTDQKISGNIIDQLKKDGFEPDNRIYPVGRLDKDTTGLLVLTNDGRVPNSFLRSKHRKSKIYEVVVDRPIGDDDIGKLKVSESSLPLALISKYV
jgi:16S rRNA U516 pseudouridylate synthase RsuA-like enzyme